MYEPYKYWEDRAAGYKAVAELEEELELLKSIINRYNVENILEVGVGNGRVYLFLYEKGVKVPYSMCDFVPTFIRKCKNNTGIDVKEWNGVHLPYIDNQFDLVVSVSVLLHVLPDSLYEVVREHIRVCKRFLCVSTYAQDGQPSNLRYYNFNHNYTLLWKTLGLSQEVDVKMEDHRRTWLLRK